jgi:ribosomal protein S18 acetylase RimI-like enzyme
MDFRFTNEHPDSRTDEIVSYLLGPRLWIPQAHYPDFEDWLGRAHRELKSERKRALTAMTGAGEIVGVVLYQRHKTDAGTVEIKNLTVRPDVRGRYLASFLVRNAEVEGLAEYAGARRVVCDAKADNVPIRLFLLKQGYRLAARADLYGLSAGEDMVFEKPLLPLTARP